MTKLTRSLPARATACLAAAILPLLSAQTAPAPAPADAGPAAEDVLKLNPFTVSTDRDRGYAASSTLAGTRLNTSLRDVAAAVTVVCRRSVAEGCTLGDEFDFTSAQALRMNRDFFRPVAKTESLSIAIV